MTYRDFAGATAVFDRQGRRGVLIFDEDPAEQPRIDDGAGWVVYELREGGSGLERLSVRTTWVHTKTVLGLLGDGSYAGPNIPADCRDSAADLDVILAKLSGAGLVP